MQATTSAYHCPCMCADSALALLPLQWRIHWPGWLDSLLASCCLFPHQDVLKHPPTGLPAARRHACCQCADSIAQSCSCSRITCGHHPVGSQFQSRQLLIQRWSAHQAALSQSGRQLTLQQGDAKLTVHTASVLVLLVLFGRCWLVLQQLQLTGGCSVGLYILHLVRESQHQLWHAADWGLPEVVTTAHKRWRCCSLCKNCPSYV